MNEKQMRKADFVTSIVLLVFAFTVTSMAFNMPRLEEKNINPYTAPGVVPGILGVIIFILALIMFIRTLRGSDFLPKFEKGNMKSLLSDPGTMRLLVSLAICLIYALVLIGNIPYMLATFIFVLAFILCFDLKYDAVEGSRKRIIVKALIQAVITSVAVSLAFEYLFLVDLP